MGMDLLSQFGQSRSKGMSLTDAGNSREEVVFGVKIMKSFLEIEGGVGHP